MPMRCGILIIGSLLWDPNKIRSDWRDSRLRMDEKIPVSAPICYGRPSSTRGKTYTMIFREDAIGKAVLVPCKKDIDGVPGLLDEARELWATEGLVKKKPIGSHTKDTDPQKAWGCVGVLFRKGDDLNDLKEGWTKKFHESRTVNVSLVSKDGILSIAWPKKVDGSELTEADVILATANKPEGQPTAEQIADAWLGAGHEEYFFNNVSHGIRTAEDGGIWKRLQRPWLRRYPEAVKTLQQEAGKGTA